MLGKKFLKNMSMVITTCLLASCSNVSENNNKKIELKYVDAVDKNENYIKLDNVDINFTKEQIKAFYNEAKELPYDKAYKFVPSILVGEDFLVGEATTNDVHKKFLATYNIKDKFVKTIKEISLDKISDGSFKVISANESYILYEEYKNENAKYILYDLKNNKDTVIAEANNIPAFHNTQGSIGKDYFVLSVLKEGTNIYETIMYSINTKESVVVSKENSGFPVFKNDELYYLEINNTTLNTKLIKYDYKNSKKDVLYKTENKDEYFNFLVSDNNNLLIGLRGEEETKVYKLENDLAKLVYKASWIESPTLKNNMLTFIGDKRNDNRIRLEYYLIDLENKKDFVNNAGIVYLSDKASVWLDYRISDAQIPKGQVFSSSNTKMLFKVNKK